MGRSKFMLAAEVLESDEYAELSIDARLLYVLLHCKADYLGVLKGPNAVMRSQGINENALQELLESGFLIGLNGFYIIRHWWVSNKQDKTNGRSGNTWIYEHVAISNRKTYETKEWFEECGVLDAWANAERFTPGERP